MGGCVASSTDWAEFKDEWAKTLDQYQIECFHMTDFENYQKAFKKMDRNRHKRLIATLLEIMNRHIDAYIGTVEDVEDHKLSPSPKDDPYINCMLVCMDSLASCFGPGDRNINVIFADQPEFRNRVSDLYPQLRTLVGGMYAVLQENRYCSPKNTLPLQAADIVAYEVRKEFERHRDAVGRQRRWPLVQLCKKPFIWRGYLPEGLKGK